MTQYASKTGNLGGSNEASMTIFFRLPSGFFTVMFILIMLAEFALGSCRFALGCESVFR